MTGSTLGPAVAAGVMAALVTIGGPGVMVAVADPGSHSSQSRDGSDRRDGRDSRRGEIRRDRGPDLRRDDRPGRHDEARGPGTRRGWQDTDSRDTDWGDSGSKDPDFGARESDDFDRSDSSRSDTGTTSRVAATNQRATPQADEPVVTVPQPQPAAPDEGGGGGGASGIGATVSADPPRVVFGNGRTPSPPAGRPDAPMPVTVSAPAPSAEPPAPAAVPAPQPIAEAPTMVQRTIAPLLTPTAPASSLSSLWGLAGLILAPLAGVLLGYRQARASKAAAELKSTLAS